MCRKSELMLEKTPDTLFTDQEAPLRSYCCLTYPIAPILGSC
jgi:hypothetical protein